MDEGKKEWKFALVCDKWEEGKGGETFSTTGSGGRVPPVNGQHGRRWGVSVTVFREEEKGWCKDSNCPPIIHVPSIPRQERNRISPQPPLGPTPLFFPLSILFLFDFFFLSNVITTFSLLLGRIFQVTRQPKLKMVNPNPNLLTPKTNKRKILDGKKSSRACLTQVANLEIWGFLTALEQWFLKVDLNGRDFTLMLMHIDLCRKICISA